MKLYIKLLNEKPVDHPITAENMETAHPHIDLNNLPEGWANFVRVEQPKLDVYETAECVYEWDGDVVKDVWYIHEMSDVEKSQKQERVKKSWAEDKGSFDNWVFDEETCTHKPPVPYPDDGEAYKWIQEAEMWVPLKLEPTPSDVTPVPYPLDGKEYDFDLSNNCWVEKK